MARSLEQIERELAALRRTTQNLSQDLQNLYDSYLKSLGQAVRQQLIMASYRICTQEYPEAFLALNLHQRQRLQEALREVAQQGQRQLGSLAHQLSSDRMDATMAVAERIVQELLAGESEEEEGDFSQPEDASPQPTADPEAETQPVAEAGETPLSSLEPSSAEAENVASLAEQAANIAALLSQVESSASGQLEEGELTPTMLAKRHFALEKSIRIVLQTLSKTANHLLQKAEVLPPLPQSLLEVATEADAIADMSASGSPNLLDVMVETKPMRMKPEEEDAPEELPEDGLEDPDDEIDESALTRLLAVNLRLSEIEFSDTTVAAWRSKLREQLRRLKALGHDYQNKQRQRAIAEAEAAWRVTWVDE